MTVGITYKSNKEAIVVVDRKSSIMSPRIQRHSDIGSKLAEIRGKDWYGVINGTGISNTLAEGYKIAENLDGTFEESVKKFEEWYVRLVNESADSIVNRELEQLARTQKLITESPVDNPKIPDLIMQQRCEKQAEVRKQIDEIVQSMFVITAYDKKSKGIRLMYFAPGMQEQHLPYIAVGSGDDLANAYFMLRTGGLQNKELQIPQLARIAAGAYSYSTFNVGVGGTPQIAIVNEEESRILETDKTAMLTNLVNASEARIIDESTLNEYIPKILDGSVKIGELTKLLGISQKMFKTIAIPPTTWQEMANSEWD